MRDRNEADRVGGQDVEQQQRRASAGSCRAASGSRVHGAISTQRRAGMARASRPLPRSAERRTGSRRCRGRAGNSAGPYFWPGKSGKVSRQRDHRGGEHDQDNARRSRHWRARSRLPSERNPAGISPPDMSCMPDQVLARPAAFMASPICLSRVVHEGGVAGGVGPDHAEAARAHEVLVLLGVVDLLERGGELGRHRPAAGPSGRRSRARRRS